MFGKLVCLGSFMYILCVFNVCTHTCMFMYMHVFYMSVCVCVRVCVYYSEDQNQNVMHAICAPDCKQRLHFCFLIAQSQVITQKVVLTKRLSLYIITNCSAY